MNLYLCTVSYTGEAESADEFGKRLTDALNGDKDAQAGIRPTMDFHIVQLGVLGENVGENA